MLDFHKKKKILHLSPHLGGGVGTVLCSYLIKTIELSGFEHYIRCFDTINAHAKEKLTASKIDFKESLATFPEALLDEIAAADIVVIHWWNHPLLYQFLMQNQLPHSRVIIWSHVSGFEAPQLFIPGILNYPDYFVFTTPVSYSQQEVLNFAEGKDKFRSIWSTGGLGHVKETSFRTHEGFNVGYIGTVDYVKLFPQVISLCSKVDIPSVRFYFCGGSEDEALRAEVQHVGLQDRFVFTGHVQDICSYLGIFDVFGYPLSKNHYGTCDQSLAEAMAVGLVPIVFDNGMERHMVEHNITGLIAKSEEEYIQFIFEIYKNSELKRRLSKNAKEQAHQRFSIEKTIFDWENLLQEAMEIPKAEKRWHSWGKSSAEPSDIFLEAIGPYRNIFLKNNTDEIKSLGASSFGWRSRTKGTVHHYASFFNSDARLRQWSQLMK